MRRLHSDPFHADHNVTLDLRRLRPVLRGLRPKTRERVVKNLRQVYPELTIDLSPRGELRIEFP